ncbi:MAG: zinc ribbon domain-containing protein [Terriglobales bacterium]
MAFCTACGARMEDTSHVCPKCGAGVSAPAAAPAPAPAASLARQNTGRNAVSIVLVVLVVVIALGVLATIGTVFALKRMARRVRVEAGPASAVVTTPFGSVTADDPAVVSQQLGVDVYPGARAIKGSAAVGFGGMQVAAAKFESDAAPDKIVEFYQRRYPKAAIRVVGAASSMVFSTGQGMITIKVRSRGDGSLIEIARVGGNGAGMDDGAKPN